jgi:hypothetical protein
MKKIIFPILVLTAWTISLSAQTTREQADAVVLEYLQSKVTRPYLLYVNSNAPSQEGIAITTFQEETVKAKYACWAYYINEWADAVEPSPHRYLFVKEENGNLLEIKTTNDLGPANLAEEWEVLRNFTAVTDLKGSETLTVFPNPVGDVLTISYGEKLTHIEIYDLTGKQLLHQMFGETEAGVYQTNISSLSAGSYIVKAWNNKGIVTEYKIIKK